MEEKRNDQVVSQPDEQVGYIAHIRPQARKLHDPNVSFEEYYYYAQKTREEQDGLEAPKIQIREIFAGKDKAHSSSGSSLNLGNQQNRLQISDEEWTNASRSLRTASAGAIFYLVCTPSGHDFTRCYRQLTSPRLLRTSSGLSLFHTPLVP